MASPTSAQIQQPDLDVAFYLRIEGLGDIAGAPETSRTLYVFTRAPDWSPSASQRFIRGLTVPASWTDSADIFGGVGDQQGATFEVMEFDDAANSGRKFWANLLGTGRYSGDPGTWPWTNLRVSMNRTDTVAYVDTVTPFASSGVLFVGNETMSYSDKATDGGGGGHRFTGLTRGLHPVAGSNYASTHRVITPEGAQIRPLVTTRPTTMYGREVSLYAAHRFPDGRWETEGNALRLWTGRIRRLDWRPDRNAWSFGCDSILLDLQRQVFSRTRAETRMVGLNLGDQVADRTLVIRGDAVDPTISRVTVTVAAWYESPSALVDDLNAQLQTAFAGLLYPPFFVYAEGGDAPSSYGGATTNIPAEHVEHNSGLAGGTVSELGPGLAQALGWRAEPTTMGLYANNRSPFAVPASCFYARGEQPVGVQIYVEAADAVAADTATEDGFLSRQGSTTPNVGWVLIGARTLMGVRNITAASGTTPAIMNCTSIISPDTVYRSDWGGGSARLFGAWSATGEPRKEDPYLKDDKIRLVFFPRDGADVLTQMLEVLSSTGTNATIGVAAYNGAYDVLAVGYGLGIKTADIDVTGWAALADELAAAGSHRQRLFAEPVSMADWIKEEGRTMGFSAVMVGGQISIRRTPGLEVSAQAVFALGVSDLAGVDERPSIGESAATVYNAVEFAYDFRAYLDQLRARVPVLNDIESQERFGLVRKLTVENPGFWASAVADPLVAAMAGRATIFREPVPIGKMRLSRRWWGRIAPLDVFTFTNPSMPDRNSGTIGVTSKIAIVRSVTHNLRPDAAFVEVEFLVTAMQRQAPLDPSALLDYGRGDGGYSAGPPTRLYCLDHEFSAASAGVDVSAFAVGDLILICEDTSTTPAAPLNWRRTVTAIGANYLEFSGGALAGFVADATHRYFVTFDVYGSITTAQRARGTSIAGTTRRISGTNDFYPYT